MTHLSPIENLFAVEVARDARNFEIYYSDSSAIKYESGYLTSTILTIPPGSYEILFTTKGCSEEQAAGMVEKDIHPMLDYILGWRDYSFKYENFYLEYAKESLQSLLRANGLDESKNYLLIKKQ